MRHRLATRLLFVCASLFLLVALVDAGCAFRSHEMLGRGIPMVLFACATGAALAGALVLLVASRSPGNV